jgi:hypothetical protein
MFSLMAALPSSANSSDDRLVSYAALPKGFHGLLWEVAV